MHKYGRIHVKDENYIRDHLDDYTDDISKMLEAVKAGKGVAYISLNEPWFNPAYVEVCRLKILFMLFMKKT